MIFKYVFASILQKNIEKENFEETNLNVSIKTEEVCIDEHLGHFFCYLLFTTNFQFHYVSNYVVHQIKEEITDHSIKIEGPFFDDENAYTSMEVGPT